MIETVGEPAPRECSAERKWRPTIRQASLWIGAIVLLAWWAPIIARAAEYTSSVVERLNVAAQGRPDRSESLTFLVVIALAVMLPPLFVYLLRPRLAVATLGVVCAALMVALAAGAGALVDLLLLLVLLAATYELGRLGLALIRCRPSDQLESVALATGLGGGLLGLATLALGLLGLLIGSVLFWPLAALAAAVGVRRASWAWARFRREPLAREPLAGESPRGWRPTFLDVCFLSIAAGYLLIGYAAGLAPDLMSDAVRHHLATARAFADYGRIEAFPHLFLSYWPAHAHALFAVGMALHGPILAKLVHTAAGVLTVATVGLIGRRVGGPSAGVLAAALVAALPVFVWEAGTGYIDLFLALYVALGALCVLHWQETREGSWALALGAALGFGVATSPKFYLALPAFALAFLIVKRPEASPGELARTVRVVIRGGLLVLLAVLATGGPWVVRSVLLTGEIPGLSVGLEAVGLPGAPVVAAAVPTLSGFGLGRDPNSLVRIPWRLTFYSSRFGENADGFVGYALLLLLPLVALLRPTRGTLALGVLIVVPFLLWFYAAQYIRYLLPTLTLVAVLLGAAAARLGEVSVSVVGRAHRYLAPVLGVALLSALMAAAVPYVATMFAYPGSLPVGLLLGRESADAYLRRLMLGYATLQRLDREIELGAPVASATDIPQLYTRAAMRTPLTGAPWILNAATPAELLERLRAENVGYLVLNREYISPEWYGVPILQPDFLRDYTGLVYAAGNVYLHRVYHDGRPPPVPRPELLANPGFEAGGDGRTPASWEMFGDGVHDTGGTRARAGRGAVLARTSNAAFIQEVGVNGGQAYRLRYWARSDEPNALTRLQINWLDARKVFLGPVIEVVPVGTEYAEKTMWTVAPAEAAYARVYVSSHDDVPAWFDEYSFTEAE